jgi:pilus assembly protein Flp/PilA
MIRLLTRWQSQSIGEERGASMVEYALLVALIAVVVIAAALFLGQQIGDKLSDVGNTLENS